MAEAKAKVEEARKRGLRWIERAKKGLERLKGKE